jgi:methyl-accepting chemotaxis protein
MINDIDKASTSHHGKDAINIIRTQISAYESGFNKVFGMIQSGQIKTPQDANKAITEYKEPIHKLENAVKEFAEESAKKMSETESIVNNIVDKTNVTMMIILLISTIFGIGVSLIITRSIAGPLKKVIAGLTDCANQVTSASGQVSSASQSLAEATSEHAASVEETSAAMEELATMTRRNASNAVEADKLMDETKRVVSGANDSMTQLTASMVEISKASEETSKIIRTIDEIAFQTNLLALNAAVEAARAGEAGTGFAVVADEVRNLAMRAAEAAKNTTSLIEGTARRVREGSEVVTKTNSEFSKLSISAVKVGELIGEISAASNEQAQGIVVINKAVTEMDKAVQQNAAGAEESASASEEMNAQAVHMQDFIRELTAIVDGNR